MFSCEFCEISQNTFFYWTPLVAASIHNSKNIDFFQGVLQIKLHCKLIILQLLFLVYFFSKTAHFIICKNKKFSIKLSDQFVHPQLLLLKETCNSLKKWTLNLWWISNKTIMEVGNITKTATFKSFLYVSYKSTQLLFFVDSAF